MLFVLFMALVYSCALGFKEVSCLTQVTAFQSLPEVSPIPIPFSS